MNCACGEPSTGERDDGTPLCDECRPIMDKLMKQILTTAADGYDSVRPGAGGCIRAKIEQQESAMTVHDLGLIRRAILSVIDGGKLLHGGSANPWSFYPHNGDWQEPGERNVAHRMEFADAIQRYIVDRLAPALKGKG